MEHGQDTHRSLAWPNVLASSTRTSSQRKLYLFAQFAPTAQGANTCSSKTRQPAVVVVDGSRELCFVDAAGTCQNIKP